MQIVQKVKTIEKARTVQETATVEALPAVQNVKLFFAHLFETPSSRAWRAGLFEICCVSPCVGGREQPSYFCPPFQIFEMNGSQSVLVISRQNASPPTRALPSLVPIAVAELGRRATQPQRHIPSVT